MIIGIIYGLYFKISIAIFFSLIIFVVIVKNEKIDKYKKIILTALITALIFTCYINILNDKYEKFYKETGQKIKLEAVIVSEPKETKYYKEYNVKSGNKRLILYTNKKDLKYGMRIKLDGDFIESETARNYKGFNYKQYLKTKKIYGSIKSDDIDIIKENDINIIAKLSNNARNKIIETVSKILPEETRGTLLGILIGNKDQIPEEIKESFRNSSLAHILATSGTHISYIILGITFLLLKSKVPRKLTYILTNLILIFFMFIAGFTASVVRASIMGILLISSKLVYRKADTLTSMATSLIIILTYNPFCILDIGLQLSYLGTLGIVTLNKKVSKYLIEKIHIPQKILNMMSVTISAQILILPIIILNFNTISLTFLLSNIVAVPLAGVIILYGYSNIFIGMFSVSIAKVIAIILNILLKILITISQIISNLPFSNILIPTPSIIYVILYYLIILNFNKKKYLKIIIVAIIILIVANLIYSILPKKLEIHIIDVGQGDSELVITPSGKKLLIDGGEKKNVLLEYLLDKQIMKLDYILVSHFDSDHCYNLTEVIEKLKVKNLIISKQSEETEVFKQIIDLSKKHKVNIVLVEAGNEINISKDVKIKILWADNNARGGTINDNSIVAKLEYKSFSMLFTGDIEEKTENRLAEVYSENVLKSSILKVAHHGSTSSSNEAILDKIIPRIAVIGVGKNNKFGHPSEKVIKRLEEYKCQIFRTDQNGEITIKVDKKGRILIDKMLN